MNILITGGGCREPIDSVRCITNSSTGRTAAFLADSFEKAGYHVTALMEHHAILPACRVKTFETNASLQNLLISELSANHYDVIIHAAAVSDFIPASVTVNGAPFPAGKDSGKIPSSSAVTVTLVQAPKLASSLRNWTQARNPGTPSIIICFKLTSGASDEERIQAAETLFSTSDADFVVSNDLSELHDGLHPFILCTKNHQSSRGIQQVATGQTETALAQALLAILHLPGENQHDTDF